MYCIKLSGEKKLGRPFKSIVVPFFMSTYIALVKENRPRLVECLFGFFAGDSAGKN